jgi:predicted amidohydrolase YtcJ
VFEVELEDRGDGSGWKTLKSIHPSSASNLEELPILHRGYFDSHLHVLWNGLFSWDLDLRSVTTPEDLLNRVEQRARSGATFVRGYGWDESRWDMSLETFRSAVASRISEDVPVLLYRVCGHSAVANQNLRNLANRRDFPLIVGDLQHPILAEFLPLPSLEQGEKAWLETQTQLLKAGVSAVGDMSLDDFAIDVISKITQSGNLRLDVQGVLEGEKAPRHESGGPFEMLSPNFSEPLDRPGIFSLRHWKKYLDGSFGSRTAWLSRPYADSGTFGDSLQNTAEIESKAKAALHLGYYLSFHVIGDAALDQALEIGSRLKDIMHARRFHPAETGLRSRHRLEHAQMIRNDQLKRVREQGWLMSIQPHHRVADGTFILHRLGEERLLKDAYRAQSLLNAEIPLALGSDAPVDTFLPQDVLRAVCSQLAPAEILSFWDSVWSFTTGSRLELGLSPGKIQVGASVFLTPPFRTSI